MSEEKKDITVTEKQEVANKTEHTMPVKQFIPATDIVETDNELMLYMDMPGVDKGKLTVKLEKSVLKIDGEIDMSHFASLKPLYTEYNVGNFTRKFELSNKIDQEKIEAKVEDGVLTLVLPKVPEMQPRSIQVN